MDIKGKTDSNNYVRKLTSMIVTSKQKFNKKTAAINHILEQRN